MKAAEKSKFAAPLPPKNLANLAIPTHILDLATIDLVRIHRAIYGPIHYNRKSNSPVSFRWDSAEDNFGVLYTAPDLETCLAETLIRGKFQGPYANKVITLNDIEDRSVSRLGCIGKPNLKLADLTRNLFAIGADGNICTSDQDNYAVSQKWSDAIFAHPAEFDGIFYPSRYNGMPAVAIFDRVRMVLRGSSMPLISAPELESFLDRYGIMLLPDSDDGWK